MKNKFFILITLCLCLCGCENYAELNRLSIATAIAIDKADDEYKVSLLIANSPKIQTSNKEGEATTTVYSAKAKDVSEAIKKIDRKTPKQLYFSHINIVIISKEIGKNGFFKTADWLIRHPQTRKKFYLMQTNDDEAGDVLKIISPLESFPSQSIATLVESNHNSRSVGDTASYSNFIGRILEKGYEPILPTIKINGSVKKGENKENLETTEPKTYLSLGPLAIYRNDKFIDLTSQKQTQNIYVLNNEAKEVVYPIKYKNNNLSIFSNTLCSKTKLKNENEIDIFITGKGSIYSINGNMNLTNYNNMKKIEKDWNKIMKKDLKKLINEMKFKYESDIFGFGNLIYKNHPKKWKKLEKNWNKKYFKKLKINIHTNLKIISTGSLNQTLEGAAK